MRKTVHTASYKALLNQLVAARNAADLTQQALAHRLKKPQSFIAKVERGERRIDVIEFLAITSALNANPIKILRSVLKLRENLL